MKFWTQEKELEAFKSKPQRMGRNTSTREDDSKKMQEKTLIGGS
jgi:hypothetical protein